MHFRSGSIEGRRSADPLLGATASMKTPRNGSLGRHQLAGVTYSAAGGVCSVAPSPTKDFRNVSHLHEQQPQASRRSRDRRDRRRRCLRVPRAVPNALDRSPRADDPGDPARARGDARVLRRAHGTRRGRLRGDLTADDRKRRNPHASRGQVGRDTVRQRRRGGCDRRATASSAAGARSGSGRPRPLGRRPGRGCCARTTTCADGVGGGDDHGRNANSCGCSTTTRR